MCLLLLLFCYETYCSWHCPSLMARLCSSSLTKAIHAKFIYPQWIVVYLPHVGIWSVSLRGAENSGPPLWLTWNFHKSSGFHGGFHGDVMLALAWPDHLWLSNLYLRWFLMLLVIVCVCVFQSVVCFWAIVCLCLTLNGRGVSFLTRSTVHLILLCHYVCLLCLLFPCNIRLS